MLMTTTFTVKPMMPCPLARNRLRSVIRSEPGGHEELRHEALLEHWLYTASLGKDEDDVRPNRKDPQYR